MSAELQISPDRDAEIEALKAQLLDRDERLLERDRRIAELEAQSTIDQLELEKMRLRLMGLLRRTYGASSERLDQLHLGLEDIEVEQSIAGFEPDDQQIGPPVKRVRRLPSHLKRVKRIIEPASPCCPDCGGAVRAVGEDVDEVLDLVTQAWQALQTVRPKYSCRACDKIVQAPPPPKPIAKGLLSFGALAHIIVAKWGYHLPFYRQVEMMAAQGLEMERSTLARSAGYAASLLDPIVSRIADRIATASKIHSDDTPVPVLDPGRGKTRTGRLWTYVIDDRNSGSSEPPVALYRFTPDRSGKHVAQQLAGFSGYLQADAFSGYDQLYRDGRIIEVACMAHFRRDFWKLHEKQPTALTTKLLGIIQQLYKIEEEVRGQPPDVRLQVRQAKSAALMDELFATMDDAMRRLSAKSETGKAIVYGLKLRTALHRFLKDGRVEIDNLIAERALRGIAIGRKNWLFAGSNAGGERAAAILTVIETCKMNGVEPEAYIADVTERIAGDWPASRWDELMPWNWTPLAEQSPVAIAA